MVEVLPSCPKAVTITPRRSQTPLVSPSNYATQIVVHPGNAWSASVEIPRRSAEQAAAWRAFFARLDGMIGTFRMGDPGYTTRGTANGAANTISGTPGQVTVTASLNGTLLEGDYIACNDRLYVVKQDSSGGTLKIWPPLRDTGGVIVVDQPTGLWRMETPDEGAYAITPGAIYQFSFSCIEAL